jgi:hypothetical protein
LKRFIKSENILNYVTKRRKFIQVGATGVIGGLAGCIDMEEETPPEQEPIDDSTNDDSTNDDSTNDDSTNDDAKNQQGSLRTIVLNNEGSSAWVVTRTEDITEEDIEPDVSNPKINLIEGQRYKFINNGGSFHPLAFRDSTGSDLLTESGSGQLEDSEPVNWVEDDGSVEFTVSSELADRLDEYYCTVHPSMVGSVDIV